MKPTTLLDQFHISRLMALTKFYFDTRNSKIHQKLFLTTLVVQVQNLKKFTTFFSKFETIIQNSIKINSESISRGAE